MSLSNRSCLLIVDVQVGFVNKFTSHIPALVESLQGSYKHVYVTRFYNQKESFYRKLIHWDRIEKNSSDFELAFKPLADAVVVDKAIYSCVSLSFLKELKSLRIDKVDVCGIDTDICVTKCAVDFFENGIIPNVLAKYCASSAGVDAHNAALKTLSRFIGKDQVIL